MESAVGAIIFFAGWLVGSVSTAWVMQRAINRQTVIPAPYRKATVFTPTDKDIERKNKRIAREAEQRAYLEEMAAWLRKSPTQKT